MARPYTPPSTRALVPLITVILVVATLYFARAVFIPLALAVLLCFILSPLATWLERYHLGRTLSVVVVSLIFIGVVGAIGYVVARQVIGVAGELPSYRQNIEKKIDVFRSGRLRGVVSTLRQLSGETSNSSGGETNANAGERGGGSESSQTGSHPLFVIESQSSPFSLLSNVLGPILGPIGTVGLVIIFSIFMLLNRESLRNRMLRLAGQGRLNRTTQAVDEAARRVSHYLLYQSLVNVSYACLVGLGLKFIGVPNPLLWGVLSGLLRYVPYIGPLIAASLPTLLSLGAFPGWKQPLLVIGLYVVIEIVTAYFVEPALYGSQTGLTSLAILVVAVFWTILWGPVGLLLSTPLTVCLVAFGKHIPQLEFMTVLFGDESVLPPEAKVYQRLLADDPEEAREIAEEYIAGHSLESFYDSVMIPVLVLAEQDRRREDIGDSRAGLLFRSIRDLVDETGQQFAARQSGSGVDSTFGKLSPLGGSGAVVAPAEGEVDEIAALMLARLASYGEQRIELIASDRADDMIRRIASMRPSVVCISAVPPFSLNHARSVYELLKARTPETKIIVGLWKFGGDVRAAKERIGVSEPDSISKSLGEVLKQVRSLGEQAA